ncbi:MAG TPA: metalloregulator ArsR/SmtB family transcription factor [Cyclobacteriaceae bacterium]|nr:metalloregulator ArsR/SmtB family transcription factor [Cyclobacteriaceae bacterium]
MNISARRDVFHAIADPTRRQIIGLIAGRKLNVNAVAENFSISRPAISKQLKILAECGLVIVRQEGRERYCEARLDQLNDVAKWVEKYRTFWTDKLNALEKFLDGKTGPSGKSKRIKH